MKSTEVAEAHELVKRLKACEELLTILDKEGLEFKIGAVTMTVNAEDPNRYILADAISLFTLKAMAQATEKLDSFGVETAAPESTITGFADDTKPLNGGHA